MSKLIPFMMILSMCATFSARAEDSDADWINWKKETTTKDIRSLENFAIKNSHANPISLTGTLVSEAFLTELVCEGTAFLVVAYPTLSLATYPIKKITNPDEKYYGPIFLAKRSISNQALCPSKFKKVQVSWDLLLKGSGKNPSAFAHKYYLKEELEDAGVDVTEESGHIQDAR